ncbi:hypothetical protein [Paenibacillus dakarensis]|uniref:hypothetical protein n=1 Tax=Paenibacillus dakarensis TaxID=1527293 RepID=UPI0006D5AE20|nr:hypothetical protein [Paenibacillus dakarensis]
MQLRPYKWPIKIELDAMSMPEAVNRIKQYDKAYLRSHQLRVRIKEDGSLRVNGMGIGRNNPPILQGRITDDRGIVMLEGVVKESKTEAFYIWVYLFCAVLLAVILIFLVRNEPVYWLATLLCGGGALLFGIIAFVLSILRPVNFKMDSYTLIDRFDQVLIPFVNEDGDIKRQREEGKA